MAADAQAADSPSRADVLAAELRVHFGERLSQCIVAYGEVTIVVAPALVHEVCVALSRDDRFAFRQLSDLCGVDYLAYGQSEWATGEASTEGFSRGVVRESATAAGHDRHPARFGVVYQLLSIARNQRLRLRCYLDADAPVVATVSDLWPSANWAEREAFDLFGILFDGHPDLRRILTDYGFIGHPFRKDFPLIGHVEVRYDAEKKRVVYQPVSIEPRVLVPRVIRAAAGQPETPAGDATDA